jgi:hypothetical protein
MYRRLIVVIIILLIGCQAYSQQKYKKGEYIYTFQPFTIPSYYFYQEITFREAKTYRRPNVSIEIKFVDKFGNMKIFEYIKIKGSDTAVYSNDDGIIFYNAERKLGYFNFETFPHELKVSIPLKQDTYKMLVTIVVETYENKIIIISKKELSTKDLIMIGNDIIYQTNNSGFNKGKDYYYLFEL